MLSEQTQRQREYIGLCLLAESISNSSSKNSSKAGLPRIICATRFKCFNCSTRLPPAECFYWSDRLQRTHAKLLHEKTPDREWPREDQLRYLVEMERAAEVGCPVLPVPVSTLRAEDEPSLSFTQSSLPPSDPEIDD